MQSVYCLAFPRKSRRLNIEPHDLSPQKVVRNMTTLIVIAVTKRGNNSNENVVNIFSTP